MKVRRKRALRKKSTNLIPAWVSDVCASELRIAAEWCVGKNWQIRFPLLLLLGYFGVRYMQEPQYQSIFKGLNLGLHEFGHYLFVPFGEFMHVAGGSLFQCMVPIIGMAMFRRQKDFFGIAIAWGWLATNLFEVATYAGDSRTQELQLVSPGASGGDIIHDWNFMLARLNMLPYDQAFAGFLRMEAFVCLLICHIYGGWLCWVMYKNPAVKSIHLD